MNKAAQLIKLSFGQNTGILLIIYTGIITNWIQKSINEEAVKVYPIQRYILSIKDRAWLLSSLIQLTGNMRITAADNCIAFITIDYCRFFVVASPSNKHL